MNVPAPNDPELDALLGAYALDALEPAERILVDAYLAENDRARDEVDELRESAASLALAPVDDITAPPELWERISRTIEEEIAQEAETEAADTDELGARRGARRDGIRGVGWTSLFAVAAAAIVIVLAAQVVSLNHRLDNVRGTGENAAAAAFTRASHASGARKVSLMPANGSSEVARVVLLPDGSGYLKNDGMGELDPEHTYQLWALTGSTEHPVAISAGVLGSNPKAAAFRTADDVHGFAITIERAPGVPQSSQKPYASASIA